MDNLPIRIKNNEKESLLKLRKSSNLFILFSLFRFAFCNPSLGDFIKEVGVPTLVVTLLAVVSLVLLIFKFVFFYKTVHILYASKYENGMIIAFMLSFIIPFGGLISFIIFLTVLFDSRKVIKILSVKNT